ncbi:MAG: metallophosphoesterase [Gemmataceae bacterium]|nr:metallophosphoesterase [Gemmataceae bacterium]
MIRLAHFSDIHVTTPTLEWQREDWFNKRLTSWFNLCFLGRGKRFAHAEEVASRMMEEIAVRNVDHLIFSGDATALGFESEIRRAAELLRVGELAIPGLAIPGNHDYCTGTAAASGHFERYFSAWQTGRRIDAYHYPFAQPVGPIWLIAVNAATGNRWALDASGTIGAAQLERLKRLLNELEPGLKILVLHFPICLKDGQRELNLHGLRDLDALLAIANAAGVNLWLHGHRHAPYHFQKSAHANFPVICAGAATQTGLWSYGEYTIHDTTLTALRREYDPTTKRFRDAETFSLSLSHNR